MQKAFLKLLALLPVSISSFHLPQVRTTRAGIVDYFKNFLKLSPQGKVDQSQIRMLSPNLALHSGVYSFTLEEDGKLRIVQVTRSCCCHQVYCAMLTCPVWPCTASAVPGTGSVL